MTTKKTATWEMPDDFFTVPSQPLPEITAERLKKAAEISNKRIAQNNQVYSSSNSHASSYATK